MKFSELAKVLEKIEKTSSRLTMTKMISDIIKKLNEQELDKALYLLMGRVVPQYIDLEFNVARKLMMRAFVEAYGKDLASIQKLFSQKGDLGIMAQTLSKNRRSSVSIEEVYQHLYNIATLEGKDSQAGKIEGILKLLTLCDPLSARFVTRMILGNMRLGVSDKTVLDALSLWSVGDKSKREELDFAYGVRGDIGYLAKLIQKKGIEGLKRVKIAVGIPIAPMLTQRESSLDGIFKRMPSFIIQPKYDGLRCQIHYHKKGFSKKRIPKRFQESFLAEEANHVRIFSRNQESCTKMFPDIIDSIKKVKAKSLILDGEIVGLNPKTGEMTPFQETVQRRRKYDISQMSQEIPVCVYAFDILYKNGKEYIRTPLKKRLQVLKNTINNLKNIRFAPSRVVDEATSFEEEFENAVTTGLEGVIVKDKDSFYEPGKRGYSWIKFKKSQRGHLIDDVDAVVLGYYHGRGMRAKFGIGAFLVGVYNKEKRRFESIAKVGTGIKDKQWGEIKKKLDGIKVRKKPKEVSVTKELSPDVWVKPEIVSVVDADELTKSPNHTAGSDGKRGYSLRFPRLKEFDRKDKKGEDATAVTELEKMFTLQKTV